ncbi:MAG: class I SAM-dependent methyltransferase [Neptunomonas phycophila]|uniref:class I SAM-dependent methyltransferase n=1 Tax=Neptunomonas phycophila TaxID=1572645 RepID=UPI003B8E8FF5
MGVEEYYRQHAQDYENPHEEFIHHHLKFRIKEFEDKSILDLCCGGGEVTKFLTDRKITDVEGCDPFTHDVYVENTNLPCHKFDFKHLATKGLDKQYDVIICSFAMHLCPDSMLHNVLYNLSVSCDTLLIITPNKKPFIDDSSFTFENEVIYNRVYSRLYTSQFAKRRE